MILKISIITCLLSIAQFAASQSCSESLSLAEENYRNGQFEEIKPKLCNCFGIALSDKNGEIKKDKFQIMIAQMKKADSIYGHQLGSFVGYWKDFIPVKRTKRKQRDSFSYLEMRRAYLLLSKVYFELGAIELAEYFTRNAIRVDPGTYLNDPDNAFNRVYNSQISTIRELSFGPVSGWLYTFPINIVNNGPGVSDFKYQSDGRVLLGGQFSYFIRPSLALNFNAWFHTLRVVYLQSANGSNDKFYLYVSDKQNWLKFPILLKWSPSRFNTNELSKTKLFFAGGFSVDYMTQAKATIIDLISDISLYDYNVAPYRNRLNFEAIGEMMLRFRLGRNYLNLGLMGGYTFKEVVDKDLIGSPENPLYSRYGILENNYKFFNGAIKASYEIRLSKRKKIH